MLSFVVNSRLTNIFLLLFVIFIRNGICSTEERSKFYLAESEPSNLHFNGTHPQLPLISHELESLIDSAETSVVFVSLFFKLIHRSSGNSFYVNDTAGRKVYEALRRAAIRNVTLYLITSSKSEMFPSPDVDVLAKEFPKNVLTKYINMSEITKFHVGIFHTKLMVVDQISFYLGSANAAFHELSEVVEIGFFGWNNLVVSKYLSKISKMYFSDVPSDPHDNTYAIFEHSAVPVNYTPEKIVFNPDTNLEGYISVSPDEYLVSPFERDADALLSVINSAKSNLIIAAMIYTAGSQFILPPIYWDTIDVALRKAAFERGVHIRMMTNITCCNHNLKYSTAKSLDYFGNIDVRVIKFPEEGSVKFPIRKLWHAKFCVSESEAWIGTNNISPDYLLPSAGVGFHVKDGSSQFPEVRQKMNDLFYKYWNSSYAFRLDY